MQYGTVQGRFLAPDGEQTPLTGHIIFEPVTDGMGDPGVDYVAVPVIGMLDLGGELRLKNGQPVKLAYGQWVARFRLKWDGKAVNIPPKIFTITGDVWITQVPGGGWEFEVVPIGDGTADLTSQNIINHNDGTATLTIG